MIVGVDAGALAITDDRLKVGVYRVTLELLKNITLIDTVNKYRLYSFSPIPAEIMNQLSVRMENRVLSPPTGYMKVRLPIDLYFNPVDVFLGVSQSLPILRKGKSIGFVHDLGFIHRPHSYDSHSREELMRQTKRLISQSDRIIAISRHVKEDIQKNFPSCRTPIFVCYEGVSDVFHDKGLAITRKKPYFLFVGSQRAGKNIPELLYIFHQFRELTGKDYELILIGGNYWPDPEIKKRIDQYSLTRCVHEMGYVSDALLSEYYRGAAAFITTTQWEGFCLPAVEAFSSGCPVIAARVGAIPEIVGQAGITIEENNRSGFIEAMIRISTKKTYRNHFIAKGLERSKLFRWKKFANDVYSVLDSV